jgi:DNA modification methylase
MSRVTLFCGDVREVLAGLPERSVQMCLSSPPYWGLRDYGQAGQLGLERTPEEYVANMVAVFGGVRRVLRADGVLWLNLGDSYAREPAKGQKFAGGKLVGADTNGSRAGMRGPTIPDGLKSKDLVGIPWMVAFALRADGWYLRSDIIWAKPNPMPESVTDRPTKSHEYLFLLTKNQTYYYDAAAIAEPGAEPERERLDRIGGANGHTVRHSEGGMMGASATRNARSVWTIATQPYAQAHFATMPEELARRCILAGSSAKACESCGAPWERVLERTPMVLRRSERTHELGRTRSSGTMLEPPTATTIGRAPVCSCEANTGAASSVVLDPFGGSGTTAAVAVGHGRQAIHVDLNPAYLELARQRIGPMFVDEGVNTDVA